MKSIFLCQCDKYWVHKDMHLSLPFMHNMGLIMDLINWGWNDKNWHHYNFKERYIFFLILPQPSFMNDTLFIRFYLNSLLKCSYLYNACHSNSDSFSHTGWDKTNLNLEIKIERVIIFSYVLLIRIFKLIKEESLSKQAKISSSDVWKKCNFLLQW